MFLHTHSLLKEEDIFMVKNFQVSKMEGIRLKSMTFLGTSYMILEGKSA